MLLPSVERFGVEHNVGTVARLGAGDVALAAQLHPGHRQNRPRRRTVAVSQGQRMTEEFGFTEAKTEQTERLDEPAVAVGEGEDVMLIVLQTGHTTCSGSSGRVTCEPDLGNLQVKGQHTETVAYLGRCCERLLTCQGTWTWSRCGR